jgi:predicted acyltransferase
VALLQVSSHDVCFLFRLNQLGLSPSVKKLLEDTCVPKIGLSLRDDLMSLHKIGDFNAGYFIDLQNHVREIGVEDLSLQKLYANFFASATAMLGCFAGEIVRSARSGARKAIHLLLLAAGLLLAGAVMAVWMPISKKLWSPSFILCVGAYSTALFALFYWLVDVLKWRWWTPFFTVIGMNAITIYLLQRIVDYKKISHFFLGGVAAHLSPPAGELLLATGYFAACWLTLYFLYRKRTFLKV